jgi:hypothetical protein
MARKSLTIDEVLAILRSTPARLGEAAAIATPAQLRRNPATGEWSANDVLAHLRSCADVWGDAIDRILGGDSSTLRAVNPRSWIDRTDYLDLEFHASLKAFEEQRLRLLELLEPLSPQEWDRDIVVTGGGKPVRITVPSYAARLARHERPHLKQIARLVGPG